MKTLLLVLVLSFGLLSAFAQLPCDKCSSEKVKEAEIHLDSLTYQIVFDFLCTFDSICVNNVEFNEYSNEIIFKVLEKNPDLFFKAILSGQLDKKIILSVLQDPLIDIDIQLIYDKVKTLKLQQNIKSEFLNTLVTAAKTNKLQLNK